MQSPKKRYYPDCYICGNKLEKKNEILPGLVHCPVCKYEHHVEPEYDQDIMERLSIADKFRNTLQFDDAMKYYQSIIDDNRLSFEAHLGLFLTTYGISFTQDQVTKKFNPVMNRILDEQPSKSKLMIHVIDMATDPYKKKHYIKEQEKYDQLWLTSKPVPIKKIHQKIIEPFIEKKVEKQTKVTTPVTDVVETKPMGTQAIKNYNIDPIIENKIKNAEIIYLKANKFSRAEKIFDEALAADPHAKQAIWGKILCKLEVSDLDLLTPGTSLKPIFPLFEQIMACIGEREDNPYLADLEKHLYKMLNQASTFDLELFDFILSWKKEPSQRMIANNLYGMIRKNLEKEVHENILWVHAALAATSRFIMDIDKDGYVTQYNDTLKRLTELKFYKDVLQMADVVLEVEPRCKETLIFQICALYKVPRLSELHHVLRDIKFMPVFEKLLLGIYEITEVFFEIKEAILETIDEKNYKFALQLIDIYVSKMPKNQIQTLNDALQEFSDLLIFHERFTEAGKYLDMLILNQSRLPSAHWSKLKIALRARTNFEVLMLCKKDLMQYKDYENAINSVEHPDEYIKFYEIHDQLRKKTMESRMFKKAVSGNFDYFSNRCKTEDVLTFVTTIHPKMEEDVALIIGEEKAAISNLLLRTLIILCIISFGFVLGNIQMLFDPLLTANSLTIATNMFSLLSKIILMGLLPLFLIVFVLTSPSTEEVYIKGLLKGILFGLISTAIFAVVVGIIPWAAVRFLGNFVLNISSWYLPAGLLGVGGLGIAYVLVKFHNDLKDSVLFGRFKPISISNIVFLSFIWAAAIIISILQYMY
jgi:tetratricopeptide (TPR) repeat protein